MKTKLIFSLLIFMVIETGLFAQEKKAGKIITNYFNWLDAGKHEQVMALLTDDFMAIAPFSPNPLDKKAWVGAGQGFKTAFPDMKHEVLDWFADDNKVAVKGKFKGTNTGPMMGNPPTGGKVTVAFNTYFELDGKSKIKSINIQYNIKEFEMQMMAGLPNPKMVNEKTIRDVYKAMDAGNADQLKNYCSSDFTISNPFLPGPAPIQAFLGIIQAQKTGFPDMKHEVVDLVSDGKFVTTRGIFSGTNTGSMMGNPPTGNKVKISFLVLDEMNGEGKIKNRVVQFDAKSFESQLMAGINPDAGMEKWIREMFTAADQADTARFMSYWIPNSKNYFAGVQNSPEDLKNRLLAFKKAFPDVKRILEEIQITKNRISVRGRLTGTNTGSFMGKPASNNSVNVSWLSMYHLNENGKIESGWVEFDTATLEKQLTAKKSKK